MKGDFSIVVELVLPKHMARVRFPEVAEIFFRFINYFLLDQFYDSSADSKRFGIFALLILVLLGGILYKKIVVFQYKV
jgi:hypothetical protein